VDDSEHCEVQACTTPHSSALMRWTTAVSQCYSIGLSWSAAAVAAPAPGAATTCMYALKKMPALAEQSRSCGTIGQRNLQRPNVSERQTFTCAPVDPNRHLWMGSQDKARNLHRWVKASLALRQRPRKQGQRLIHHACRLSTDVICNLVHEAGAIKHESPKHHAHPPSLSLESPNAACGWPFEMDAWRLAIVAPWRPSRDLWQTQQN
jgi:hypothetical protein